MRNDNEPGRTMPHNNAEYAKHWIAYLQKKNAVLSIVWPILLIISVLLLVAALYFFQREQSALKRSQELNQLVDEMQAKRAELVQNLRTLEAENGAMSQEIELLRTVKKSLEEQKEAANARQDLTRNMADTLKETVNGIEAENAVMKDALAEAKKMLIKQEKDNAHKMLALKTQHSKSTQISMKALADRKIAYRALVQRQNEMQDEIERLAGVVNRQDIKLAEAAKTRSRLQVELQSYRQQVEKLEQTNDQLNQELIAQTEPVPEGANVSAPELNDGLDEIRAPVVTNKAAKKSPARDPAAAFDFDSIATE